ncbi:hypothetical protein [Mesobacillus sp.]|uniref:hypothetical protein n=1 Tax=Mesobacillus sp. TaxID=2675271 RepID=UPI0039EF4CBB
MARKTDEERLQELEDKIKQIEEKKRLVKARLSQKERKARTKRLIEVGAVFEKYFGIEGPEEAEKVARVLQKTVDKNRDRILKYPESEETLLIPESKNEGYNVKGE